MMKRLARLALGAAHAECAGHLTCWALLDALRRHGLKVQHFHGRACFAPVNGALAATGLTSRHLDSWLMPPHVCRELFQHSSRDSDCVVVEGRYRAAAAPQTAASLEALCDWLDLARLAVLDVSNLCGCRLPPRPQADALLLEGLSSEAELLRVQTSLESLWGLPVLGGLPKLPQIEEAIRACPRGTAPSPHLCRELGEHFLRFSRLEAILRLADRPPLPAAPPSLFRDAARETPMVIALAYDDAFNCYFPDVLDLLEAHGAKVRDFSPLSDEALPPHTDLLYLGCGHPERHAARLAKNVCLLEAIRNHVRAGGRVYAEGGGLAYLCEELAAEGGRQFHMVGIFPAVASLRKDPQPPVPVELTLAANNWLGPAGTRLRGYLNCNWQIQPLRALHGQLQEYGHAHDLIARGNALGSRLHLNFAALPEVFSHFIHPPCQRALVPSLHPR
jgi:cobyrinic acid a,c-diamide synthase